MSPSPPRGQPRCVLPVAVTGPPDTLMLVVCLCPDVGCCHSHLLRWLYVPFLQFMPIIIIIVIQHHRITPRHNRQGYLRFVSTVVILLLKSNFININPTQLNYDSIINFGNNSSAITTIHWSSLFVGRIYNIQSTRLHNWRGLSFVL